MVTGVSSVGKLGLTGISGAGRMSGLLAGSGLSVPPGFSVGSPSVVSSSFLWQDIDNKPTRVNMMQRLMYFFIGVMVLICSGQR